MGQVVPRPALRAAGNRRIKARLARHAELQAELEAAGHDKATASRMAYEQVLKEIPR